MEKWWTQKNCAHTGTTYMARHRRTRVIWTGFIDYSHLAIFLKKYRPFFIPVHSQKRLSVTASLSKQLPAQSGPDHAHICCNKEKDIVAHYPS